jgi:Cu(I)/Ag(I) efflux system membrane fusion protein
MKKTILLVAVFAVIAATGYWFGHRSSMSMDGTMQMEASEEDSVLYWVAPMDSNFRRDQPGLSPMGMELIPVYANQQEEQPYTVKISPNTVQMLGVRTGKVSVEPWQKSVDTVGHATWDEGSQISIYSRSEGWLETFNLQSAGDRISEGDTLFEIYSPHLVTAQREYVDALRSGSNGLIKASKQRLMALGVDAQLVSSITSSRKVMDRIPYRASSDSIVTSLNSHKGSYVMPNTLIGTMVAADSIWLEANILESEIGVITLGDSAEIKFSAFPTRGWNGTVSHIYPGLDSATRTVRVRVALDNPSGEIKAGMLAAISLQSTSEHPTLQAPKEAIIHAGGGARAVVQNGDGSFTVRPVRIGRTNRETVEILAGLIDGDEIVTSAQFLIDSEANGAQAIARLDSLGHASGMGTILGFPERGQVRLSYFLYGEEPERKSLVVSVASSINLMPYNKADQVHLAFTKDADGELTLVDIRPAAMEMSDD